MFGLPYARNSRVDGHVSAHGIPKGVRVVASACSPPHEPRTRTSVPFVMPSWDADTRGVRASPARSLRRRRDEMRMIFDKAGDWGQLLAAFAQTAAAQ